MTVHSALIYVPFVLAASIELLPVELLAKPKMRAIGLQGAKLGEVVTTARMVGDIHATVAVGVVTILYMDFAFLATLFQGFDAVRAIWAAAVLLLFHFVVVAIAWHSSKRIVEMNYTSYSHARPPHRIPGRRFLLYLRMSTILLPGVLTAVLREIVLPQ